MITAVLALTALFPDYYDELDYALADDPSNLWFNLIAVAAWVMAAVLMFIPRTRVLGPGAVFGVAVVWCPVFISDIAHFLSPDTDPGPGGLLGLGSLYTGLLAGVGASVMLFRRRQPLRLRGLNLGWMVAAAVGGLTWMIGYWSDWSRDVVFPVRPTDGYSRSNPAVDFPCCSIGDFEGAELWDTLLVGLLPMGVWALSVIWRPLGAGLAAAASSIVALSAHVVASGIQISKGIGPDDFDLTRAEARGLVFESSAEPGLWIAVVGLGVGLAAILGQQLHVRSSVASSDSSRSKPRRSRGSGETRISDAGKASTSGSHRPETKQKQKLGIDCPHCQVRPLQTAKEVWFLRGFLLFARYGRQVRLGCHQCVRTQILTDCAGSLVLGWWCVPWGLGTPFVVLQNLLMAFTPGSDAQLDRVLADLGIRREDVEVDEDGLNREIRRLYELAVAVFADAARTDGKVDAAELEVAAEAASAITGGLVSEARARRDIARHDHARPPLSGVPSDLRLILLHVAAEIVGADEHVSTTEAQFLYRLGSELGLDTITIEAVLERLRHIAGGEAVRSHDPQLAKACRMLGVPPTATPIEIRNRYRAVMMTVHPDLAGSDDDSQARAHEEAQDVNWAYQYLIATTAEVHV